MQGIDSDGEQSDFKTTTLRFTNNNFINDQQRQQRDNSQNREGGQNPNGSLLNTLNSQNNPVQQLINQ